MTVHILRVKKSMHKYESKDHYVQEKSKTLFLLRAELGQPQPGFQADGGASNNTGNGK